MIRTMSFSSGVLALLLALAPGVASGHVGLAGVQGGGKVAPADVQRFIGDWTLALQGPDGPGTFDLSVKNPNGGEAVAHRTPQDIMDEIAALDAESAEVLAGIRGLL